MFKIRSPPLAQSSTRLFFARARPPHGAVRRRLAPRRKGVFSHFKKRKRQKVCICWRLCVRVFLVLLSFSSCRCRKQNSNTYLRLAYGRTGGATCRKRQKYSFFWHLRLPDAHKDFVDRLVVREHLRGGAEMAWRWRGDGVRMACGWRGDRRRRCVWGMTLLCVELAKKAPPAPKQLHVHSARVSHGGKRREKKKSRWM